MRSPPWVRTTAAAPTRWCSQADDAYLGKLHDAGVRGARFSFRKELGAVLSDADFARAIARIRELGWYAKIQPEKDGIVSSVAKYESLDVPVLIDHMARPDPVRGNDDPNLQKMLVTNPAKLFGFAD